MVNQPRKFGKIAVREAVECYLFISPAVLGFLFFTLFPIVVSFYYSFSDYDMINPPQFTGLTNYIEIFSDPLFWQSLKVSFLYAIISVPVGMVSSLFLAILLNRKVKGVVFFRMLVYVPSVLSGVAVALMWAWIFNPSFGILNILLGKIGIQGPQWIFSQEWALPSLIIMSLWGIGGGILINLAGLQSVPTDLYEEAEIDGVNWWQKYYYVTLPLITPVIFFNLVMGIIGSLQTFTQAYVMTKGGPNNATLFYVLYLFRNAFEWFKMGYASAMAWILLLIILVITLLVFRSTEFWVYYEGERK